MVGKLTYYERWIVAFANILFQKGILTPERARAEDGRGRGPMACRAGRRWRGTSGPMNVPGPPVPETCFFERDPELALSRRMVAEGVGTLLLMLAATGGGLTAQRLFPDSPGLGVHGQCRRHGRRAGRPDPGLWQRLGRSFQPVDNRAAMAFRRAPARLRPRLCRRPARRRDGGGPAREHAGCRRRPAHPPTGNDFDAGRQRVPSSCRPDGRRLRLRARGAGRNRPLRCGRVARRCDPGDTVCLLRQPRGNAGRAPRWGPSRCRCLRRSSMCPRRSPGRLSPFWSSPSRTRNITSEVNRRP